jgi:Protein of unknown function, DUF488
VRGSLPWRAWRRSASTASTHRRSSRDSGEQTSASCWTCGSVAAFAVGSTHGRTPGDFSGRSQKPGIEYRHHIELAPTTELRQLQYREDEQRGVGKRSRVALAPEFRERYESEILSRVDLAPIVADMPSGGASALFCVEGEPEACHRSLIAERLAKEHRITVRHLRP